MNAVFQQFGCLATYTPASGDRRVLRVIAKRPDTEVRFEDTRLIASTALFEVRTSELAAFRPNELITLDGVDYAIQAARRLDPDRLVWTLESYALAPEEAPPPVEPAPERFVQGIWDGSYTALPEVAVEVGHMIHLTATNLLALSRADADDTALVAGVVVAGAAAGHGAEWTVDHPVERPDWSALTEDGVSLLEPGAPYFLSVRVAGGISLTPPTVPGQWVVPVGHAVAPTVLHVTPGTPVRL
ncbi:MAG: hypothetical protein WCJ64_06900 [Rhodospirillaceae bacterium]